MNPDTEDLIAALEDSREALDRFSGDLRLFETASLAPLNKEFKPEEFGEQAEVISGLLAAAKDDASHLRDDLEGLCEKITERIRALNVPKGGE